MRWVLRSVLSAVGPQAKEMCRLRMTTRVHSRGKAKLGWLRHHTFSPDASTNLTSRVFTGASARIHKEISKFSGNVSGSVRVTKA